MVVILIVHGATFPEHVSSYAEHGVGDASPSSSNSVSYVSTSSNSSYFQVEPEQTLAKTKEEEWVTKKKVELTTKKQIETRVKRQVVLEDGKVVEDSGPMVTTNTTEDTQQQEHEHTEHREIDDDNRSEGEGWVPVESADGVVKEVREKKTKSREEKEHRVETEDVKYLGDISDRAYQEAIQNNQKDLRVYLQQANREKSVQLNTGPRIVHESTKGRKVIDIEDTKHLNQIAADGKLVTYTETTNEHEEINENEDPDNSGDEEEEYEHHTKSSQRFRKTKDKEVVEYLENGVKIGEEVKYEAETTEGDRQGEADKLGIEEVAWETLSDRIRRMRRAKQLEADRKDALTNRPLNFNQEEQTRKVETSKWLESHFGSESRSSRSSDDELDGPKSKTSTSFINVTMKSDNKDERRSKAEFFKGISEWNEATAARTKTLTPSKARVTSSMTEENQIDGTKTIVEGGQTYSPFQPIKQKVLMYHNRHRRTHRTSSPNVAEEDASDSSPNIAPATPLYASVQQRVNGYNKNTSSSNENSSSSPEKGHHYDSLTTNRHSRSNGILKDTKKSNLIRRQSSSVSGLNTKKPDEPLPDYSPKLKFRRAPSTPDVSTPETEHGSSPEHYKKPVYHKNTFSADIPPVHRSIKPARPPQRKSSFKDTLKKFVGKLRSSSGDRKKNNKNGDESGYNSTYHSFSDLEGNNTDHEKEKSNSKWHLGRSNSNAAKYNGIDVVDHVPHNTQTLDRNYRYKGEPNKLKKKPPRRASQENILSESRNHRDDSPSRRHTSQHLRDDSPSQRQPTRNSHDNSPSRKQSSRHTREDSPSRRQSLRHAHEDTLSRRQTSQSPAQKYYLGEDPYEGSIYGNESGYEGVSAFKKSSRKNEKSTREYKNSDVKFDRYNGETNGNLDSRGGVQTLPRNLRQENKRHLYDVSASSDQETAHSRRSYTKNKTYRPFGHSETNVSISDNARSSPISMDTPTKPARTYLSRSKSFNAQLLPIAHQRSRHSDFGIHKSNPQLHRIDESPPPLRSPGIVTSVNRSTRDLSKSVDGNLDSPYRSEYPSLTRYDGKTKSTYFSGDLPPKGNGKVDYVDSFRSNNSRKPTVSFDIDNDVTDGKYRVSSPTNHKRSSSPLNPILTNHNRSATPFNSVLSHRERSSSPTKYRSFSPTNNKRSSSPLSPITNHNRSSSPYNSTSTNRNRSSSSPKGNYASLNNLTSTPVKQYFTPLTGKSGYASLSNLTSTNKGTPYRPVSPLVGNNPMRSPSPINGKTRTYTISSSSSNGTNGPKEIVNRSVSKTGTNDDYSETIRTTSKSTDPTRPSVTNIVQNFSKKIIPDKDGRKQTIESSSTSKVTKSHRSGSDASSERNSLSSNFNRLKQNGLTKNRDS